MKIKGYTRSDGVKVKAYTRTGRKSVKKKYTAAQQRAFDKSKTSKSGHKSWRERQKDRKPGLWSFYWRKHRRSKNKS